MNYTILLINLKLIFLHFRFLCIFLKVNNDIIIKIKYNKKKIKLIK